MHVSNILFIRRQRLGKCTCQQSNRSISSAVHFYCLSACFVKFDTHRRELDASDACYSFEIWKSKYLDITSIGIRFLHQGFIEIKHEYQTYFVIIRWMGFNLRWIISVVWDGFGFWGFFCCGIFALLVFIFFFWIGIFFWGGGLRISNGFVRRSGLNDMVNMQT